MLVENLNLFTVMVVCVSHIFSEGVKQLSVHACNLEVSNSSSENWPVMFLLLGQQLRAEKLTCCACSISLFVLNSFEFFPFAAVVRSK